MEQAIADEVAALNNDIASDAEQLLQRVEAESEKHLMSMNDNIGALQRELHAINELLSVIDSVKQSGNVGQLVRSFRVLHTSASDLIGQHRQQQKQLIQVVVHAIQYLRDAADCEAALSRVLVLQNVFAIYILNVG